MKSLCRLTAVLFSAVLLLGASALRAGDAPEGAKGKGDREGKRIEMLKAKLDLSDSQVAQLKEAFKGQKEAGKALRDKVKADQANLAVLVDKKASDDQLKAALKELSADRKAMMEQGAKAKEAMEAILTPMQQAKMAGMMGERKGKGGWGKKEEMSKACPGHKDGIKKGDKDEDKGKDKDDKD
jgi:Spy/CpxP family protein refolding chaperone